MKIGSVVTVDDQEINVYTRVAERDEVHGPLGGVTLQILSPTGYEVAILRLSDDAAYHLYNRIASARAQAEQDAWQARQDERSQS